MIEQFTKGQCINIFDKDEFHPGGVWVTGEVLDVTQSNVIILWEDLEHLTEYDLNDKDLTDVVIVKTNAFWSFVHNAIAHPLLVTGTSWSNKFHDWTADKM